MDVIVENYKNVQAFEFGFVYDTTLFQYVSVKTLHLNEPKLGGHENYDFENNRRVTIAYFEFNPNPDNNSLEDGTIAFSLCFQAIGEVGATSSIEVGLLTNENPPQIFADHMGFLVPDFNLVPGDLIIGEEKEEFLPFVIGTEWRFLGNYIVLDRDTLIDGTTWYGMSELDNCAPDIQDHLIRKEEDIIMMYDPKAKSSYLLYDFSKKAGESWEINFPDGCSPYIVNVDSVSTTTVSGVTVGIQYVSTDSYSCYEDFEVIYEGIGSANYFFPKGNLCDFGAGPLICYFTQGQEFIFRSDLGCIRTSSLSTVNNYEVDIYPNPVHDRLYLTGNDQNLNSQIFNLQGQQMMEGVYQDYIQVELLPPGIYFLRLKKEGVFVKAIKFVKN